jgi:hypothetical protein
MKYMYIHFPSSFLVSTTETTETTTTRKPPQCICRSRLARYIKMKEALNVLHGMGAPQKRGRWKPREITQIPRDVRKVFIDSQKKP